VRLATSTRTGLITSCTKLRYHGPAPADERPGTADLARWLSEAWHHYQGTWAAVDQVPYDLCRRRWWRQQRFARPLTRASS